MSTEKIAEVKLNPAVEEMKGKIYEAIAVSNTGDVEKTDNVYESTLPEDITIDMVKRINIHNELFIAAAYDAVGDAARGAALEHEGIKQVNATFGMTGRNSLHVQWDRAVERNAGIAEKGKVAPKKTVYGAMSGKLTVAGTDTGSGELGKVARRQKQAAQDMFAPAVTA